MISRSNKLHHRIFPLAFVLAIVVTRAGSERRNLMDDLKNAITIDKETIMPMGEALLLNENLSSECTTSMIKFLTSLQAGKMWAMKMMISSSIIPQNMFFGQTQAHGSLDQCVGKPFIRGDEEEELRAPQQQYCKMKLSFDSNTTGYEDLAGEIFKTSGLNIHEVPPYVKGIYTGLVISLCLPKQCSASDIQVAMDMMEETYGISAELTSCQTNDPEPVETKQIFVILLLICIFLLSLIGLVVEANSCLIKKSFLGRFLRCFALDANWASLLDTGNRESNTYFLNGLKLLLCLWISAGHMIIFPSPEFTYNPGAFFNVVSRSLWFQLFSNINLAVVGFFFISGFLIHNGTKRFSTENPIRYIITSFVRRYLKLVVPAFVVLLTTFLYPLLSHTTSPREGFYYNNIGTCSERWYLFLCLMNNYIDIFKEQCLIHLWYIATDLKIYPFIVALSVLYRRHPEYSKVISYVIVAFTSILVGILTYVEGAAGVVARADLEGKRYVAAGMALDIYTRPYTQIAAYIMGFLCAIVVERKNERLRQMGTMLKTIMWALAIALFVVQAFLITYSTIQVFSPAGIGMSIYSGVSRPLHALIYMWIVIACALRLAGPLSRFLSHPIMHVLGKLSYGVYLVHFPLASLGYGNFKNATLQFNGLLLSHYVLGNLMQSFILATMLFVFVEKPIANLDKLFINRSQRSANNLDMTYTVTAAQNPQAPVDNLNTSVNHGTLTASQSARM